MIAFLASDRAATAIGCRGRINTPWAMQKCLPVASAMPAMHPAFAREIAVAIARSVLLRADEIVER